MTNGANRFTLYSNFLPIVRCGEGDGAGDVEVVGEGAAVYLFGQAVVAGGEVEQADMGIDGSGVVGGYGAQDGGEAEVLGEGDLLPVAVSLALDGVLLSVVHIVVVGIDNPRLHHGVVALVDDTLETAAAQGLGLLAHTVIVVALALVLRFGIDVDAQRLMTHDLHRRFVTIARIVVQIERKLFPAFYFPCAEGHGLADVTHIPYYY